jgi:two-component system chemotaxis family response regulator WspR
MHDPAHPPAGLSTGLANYTTMVMLMDDQAMVGEAVRRALAGQPDINFHYCDNPEDAIAFAERVRPTVILQDLVLPGIDGLTLVRQYRASAFTKDIPIVVLSTEEDPVIKSEAFKAGANDYLVKLPDPIELIARIRYHSHAYLHLLQRDEAYQALRESQQQLLEINLVLTRLNNMDGLTELNNRRRLNEYLEAEWKRSIRQQTLLSVLLIDIDDFKLYNDTYGHVAGDEALKQVAHTLQQSVERSTDLVARFGGEEFCVIVPATAEAGARYLGEKICAAVERLAIPHSASSAASCLTVSVGVASVVPEAGNAPERLLEAADVALYDAKKAGKNRTVAVLCKS